MSDAYTGKEYESLKLFYDAIDKLSTPERVEQFISTYLMNHEKELAINPKYKETVKWQLAETMGSYLIDHKFRTESKGKAKMWCDGIEKLLF